MHLPMHKEGSARAPFRVYVATSIVLFFLTLSAAESIGFVPYYVDGSEPTRSLALADLPQLGERNVAAATASFVAPATEQVVTVLPERLRIDSIGLDLPVQNPETRDITALDELLKKGPARYTDSAKLGESGNMIIFAHSSRLPVVHNQMYKAFNRVSELDSGDVITLEAEGRAYLYAVTSVKKVDISDTVIDLSIYEGTRLTLVTCDTLTGKSARFLVEAEFVGSLPLASDN